MTSCRAANVQGARPALTVRSLEFEGLAVLVGDGVGGGVEGHASGENERLGPKPSEDDFDCDWPMRTVTISGEATKE